MRVLFKETSAKVESPMELSPRLTAAISLGALVPIAVYAIESGELTAITAAFGVVNTLIIVVSLVVMFGPVNGSGGDHASTA